MNKETIYKNSKDEWYTPIGVINYVKKIAGGITLDPATTEWNAKRMGIKKFYTIETNGLDKDWQGEIVWLNPPFTTKKDWIKKARQEVNKGDCKVFILLPMSMETVLWQEEILGHARLHIPNRRISFIDSETLQQKKDIQLTNIVFEMGKMKSAPFGSAIIEMTKEPNCEYVKFEIGVRGKQ